MSEEFFEPWEKATPGFRYQALVNTAILLSSPWMGRDNRLRFLNLFNQSVCDPPLSFNEVMAIDRSVQRRVIVNKLDEIKGKSLFKEEWDAIENIQRLLEGHTDAATSVFIDEANLSLKDSDLELSSKRWTLSVSKGLRSKLMRYMAELLDGSWIKGDQYYRVLRNANNRFCRPPLSEWELQIIARQVVQDRTNEETLKCEL